jgi:hypothetical protein
VLSSGHAASTELTNKCSRQAGAAWALPVHDRSRHRTRTAATRTKSNVLVSVLPPLYLHSTMPAACAKPARVCPQALTLIRAGG